MRISELYGSVAQGEGVLLGVSMPFIRVGGCNLACSWCDSAYTWRKNYHYIDMSVEAIVGRVLHLEGLSGGASGWVSLTGGEPTLYAVEVDELARKLARIKHRLLIETNGLRAIPAFNRTNVYVSCSPKLPGSGQDSTARRAKVAKLVASRMASASRRARTQWKFVITGEPDLVALGPYCAEVGIDLSGNPKSPPVYVQPDGYVQPIGRYLEALRWLQENAPPTLRVTPQVHRLIHGPDAKGV